MKTKEPIVDESQKEETQSTLQEGEEMKITVVIKNGDVISSIECKDAPVPAMVIGALEIAKTDILHQVMGLKPSESQIPDERVQITLTEEDFLLDGGEGQLTAQKLKVGDTIDVPLPVFELREQAIQQLRRRAAGSKPAPPLGGPIAEA